MLTFVEDLPNFVTRGDVCLGELEASHSRPIFGTQDDVCSLMSVLNANAASCMSLHSRSITTLADTIYSSTRLIGCLRQAKILPTQICGPRSEHRIFRTQVNLKVIEIKRDSKDQAEPMNTLCLKRRSRPTPSQRIGLLVLRI